MNVEGPFGMAGHTLFPPLGAGELSMQSSAPALFVPLVDGFTA